MLPDKQWVPANDPRLRDGGRLGHHHVARIAKLGSSDVTDRRLAEHAPSRPTVKNGLRPSSWEHLQEVWRVAE
jgi:hypothetical protein